MSGANSAHFSLGLPDFQLLKSVTRRGVESRGRRVVRLAARRLPKCSTACNQSSGDRFNRSRIGGAFFRIAPRLPGLSWRPVQSSNCRYSASVMNTQPLFEALRLEHFSRPFFRFGSNSTGANHPAFWPCSIRTSFESAVDTSSEDFRSAMRS